MGTKLQSYAARRAKIMADPAASYWLKAAIDQLDRRDPCNALADAGCLLDLMKVRLEEIEGPYFPDRPDAVKQREFRQNARGGR